jgi:hypothetical protein
MTKRKIVQIAVGIAVDGAEGYFEKLYALCNDGSLWRLDGPASGRGQSWNSVRKIPQPDEVEGQ